MIFRFTQPLQNLKPDLANSQQLAKINTSSHLLWLACVPDQLIHNNGQKEFITSGLEGTFDVMAPWILNVANLQLQNVYYLFLIVLINNKISYYVTQAAEIRDPVNVIS